MERGAGQTGRNPPYRLIGLGAAFLATIGLLAILLFPGEPTEEERLIQDVDRLIEAVEKEELDTLLAGLTPYVSVDFMGRERLSGMDEVEERAERLFRTMEMINLRPGRPEVTFDPSGRHAEMILPFHWLAAHGMYPNMYSRSRDMTKDGRPFTADIELFRQGEEWLVQDVKVKVGVE